MLTKASAKGTQKENIFRRYRGLVLLAFLLLGGLLTKLAVELYSMGVDLKKWSLPSPVKSRRTEVATNRTELARSSVAPLKKKLSSHEHPSQRARKKPQQIAQQPQEQETQPTPLRQDDGKDRTKPPPEVRDGYQAPSSVASVAGYSIRNQQLGKR